MERTKTPPSRATARKLRSKTTVLSSMKNPAAKTSYPAKASRPAKAAIPAKTPITKKARRPTKKRRPAKKRRPSKKPHPAETPPADGRSPFLLAPPEIRLMIYEELLPEVEKLRIRYYATIYDHPLSRVCHELRNEFNPYHLTRAKEIEVHIKDFTCHSTRGSLKKTLRNLPPPAQGIDRVYSLHLFLTNNFDKSVCWMDGLFSAWVGMPVALNDLPITMDYDLATFNRAEARKKFERLDRAGIAGRLRRAFREARRRKEP